MREERQIRSMLDMLGARTREAEAQLSKALAALEAAEREHAACLACVETESARLNAVTAWLGSPDVSNSAARYADGLALRDLAARDLRRERFVFERAVGEREEALGALAASRLALARLRSREDALRERLGDLGRERERYREQREESEVEELAATRYAQGANAHG